MGVWEHLPAMHCGHSFVCVCCVQVMSHAAAAQSAGLVFLCVHRENYKFLEALEPQLKGKVSTRFVSCIFGTERYLISD